MIRKYRETDSDRVLDIWNRASALAHPFLEPEFVEKVKKDMRELYLPNAETWVYESDDKTIGFISMLENEIGGLFVLPDHHSKGIGTKLVNFVNDLHEELEVEVFRNNKIGRAFYDKYGFQTMKKYVHDETKLEILRMNFKG